MKRQILYHLLALVTVSVWGVTFVSTKILIGYGLTPVTIFIIRFALAYLCALAFSYDKLLADSSKDEFLLFCAGITGGSLYFICENSALGLTFASNVSLIICCAPIFTMLLGKTLFKDRISSIAWIGSATAFLGVGLVVFNGAFNYNLNPMGDLLTLIAALSWAVYCMLLKRLNATYSNMFINRKVFFYGLLTAMLWAIPSNSLSFGSVEWQSMAVTGNLLFLGVGASFLCYLMWNGAVKTLGVEKTANYIYLVPPITIAASAIIISEPISVSMIIGTVLIVGGVFLSTKS